MAGTESPPDAATFGSALIGDGSWPIGESSSAAPGCSIATAFNAAETSTFPGLTGEDISCSKTLGEVFKLDCDESPTLLGTKVGSGVTEGVGGGEGEGGVDLAPGVVADTSPPVILEREKRTRFSGAAEIR